MVRGRRWSAPFLPGTRIAPTEDDMALHFRIQICALTVVQLLIICLPVFAIARPKLNECVAALVPERSDQIVAWANDLESNRLNEIMAEVGQPTVIILLRKMLYSRKQEESWAALEALREIKLDSNIDDLAGKITELTGYQPGHIKASAVRTIGALHLTSAIPKLQEITRQTEWGKPSHLAKIASQILYDEFGLLQYHSLYNQIPNFAKFSSGPSVEAFEMRKTGSRNIVLGGPLTGKVMARVVDKEAYLYWLKAYSAGAEWTSTLGYNPVEPTWTKEEVEAMFGKDLLPEIDAQPGQVIVYTRVFGRNMYGYLHDLSRSQRTLYKEKMDQIRNILAQIRVNHGHLHETNFCLGLFDDKRLYVIDFDGADGTANP
jgi:hypothetical protein